MCDRDKFEKWISDPPYERELDRWPDDPSFAWPGNYKEVEVQFAWDAWRESRRAYVDNQKAAD